MSTDGRSPIRPRQLHDLRLMPTATDPRPAFFWSAEGGRDEAVTHSEFPKLLWHGETHTEITVTNRDEQQAMLAMGYVMTAPDAGVPNPELDIATAFAGLSEEEQTLILEAQSKQRQAEITAKLAALTPEALDRVLAAASGDQPVAKKRGRPAKVA